MFLKLTSIANLINFSKIICLKYLNKNYKSYKQKYKSFQDKFSKNQTKRYFLL